MHRSDFSVIIHLLFGFFIPVRIISFSQRLFGRTPEIMLAFENDAYASNVDACVKSCFPNNNYTPSNPFFSYHLLYSRFPLRGESRTKKRSVLPGNSCAGIFLITDTNE